MKATILLFIILFIFSITQTNAQESLIHYTKDDGLESTWVRDCAEDQDGNMWFTTDKGLNRWDGTTFSSLDKKNGLPLKTLMKLFVDDNGIIWFTMEPPNHFANSIAGPLLRN